MYKQFSILFGVGMMSIVFANSPQKLYTKSTQAIPVTTSHPEFTIKVTSNPTTGYSWFLENYDRHVVAPVSYRFVAPNSKLVGAPGYSLWTFRLIAKAPVPVSTKIVLTYARPWEAGGATDKVFIVRANALGVQKVSAEAPPKKAITKNL